VWTRLAATLGGDQAAVKRIDAEIAAHTGNSKVGPHIRYLLGTIPAKQLAQSSRTTLQKAYAHWILGIEAEARKDRSAALKEYHAAQDQRYRGQGAWVPRAWIKRLEAPAESDTKPAEK